MYASKLFVKLQHNFQIPIQILTTEKQYQKHIRKINIKLQPALLSELIDNERAPPDQSKRRIRQHCDVINFILQPYTALRQDCHHSRTQYCSHQQPCWFCPLSTTNPSHSVACCMMGQVNAENVHRCISEFSFFQFYTLKKLIECSTCMRVNTLIITF